MRTGQATTEYLLLLSVLAIALAVAAYAFVPTFSEGVDGLSDDSTRLLSAGTQDGAQGKR